MGAVATFSPGAFYGVFPEFAKVTEDQLQAAFVRATMVWSNDGSGPVSDADQQGSLLNLLVAHICALNYGVNGEPPSSVVGRVSSASQGSVSVSVDLPNQTRGSAWYAQTRYGLEFWQATAAYRTARYIPSPGRNSVPAIAGLSPWLR